MRLALLLALIGGVAVMHTVGHTGHETAEAAAADSAEHEGHPPVPSDGLGAMCLAVLGGIAVAVAAVTRFVPPRETRHIGRTPGAAVADRAPSLGFALRLKRVAVLRI